MTKDNINIHIGQVIHTYRKLRNLTLAKLAEELDISYQQLQKYEKGTNKISADKLYLLAEVLGAEPVEFFPNNNSIASIADESQQKITFAISNLKDESLRNSLLNFLERLHQLDYAEKLNYQN